MGIQYKPLFSKSLDVSKGTWDRLSAELDYFRTKDTWAL